MLSLLIVCQYVPNDMISWLGLQVQRLAVGLAWPMQQSPKE